MIKKVKATAPEAFVKKGLNSEENTFKKQKLRTAPDKSIGI